MPPTIGSFIWTTADNRSAEFAAEPAPQDHARCCQAQAPARSNDVNGLLPTLIGVGSIDRFCKEGIEYARRLIHAGGSPELLVVAGAYCSFDVVAKDAHVTNFAMHGKAR